ncbi:BMC domain-containing protein [Escherichia fergusonii]|uniref:BMC domain-containing protein n=1 Tax=Escherichia fergusonii TaxID=564 RepID=UPI00209AC5FE|nr:BMC domain-containing protein [Escherichia fergusonii]MCO7988464.1 BMC domain-containing protein [Escherichia fergusonii]
MNSLGVIETRGLVAAIQAVDAACKAAGVSCIGYRKVGSGLVSVCFEGEISAVYTAIERGIAVASATDHKAKSLVIARPERCVVEALSNLKGHPPRVESGQKPHAELPTVAEVAEVTVCEETAEVSTDTETAMPVAEKEVQAPIVEVKSHVHKKGKKA